MNRSAAIFLVLLRLTIGWHFLFEGLQKVHSHFVGPTLTNKPFSSAGYFREAPGPAGWGWRWMQGDPDRQALARLEVIPSEEGDGPAKPADAYNRLPPALAEHWKGLVVRYVEHYGVDSTKARAIFEQHGNDAVRWLEWQPAPVLEDIRKRFSSLDTVDESLLNAAEKVAYQEYRDYTTEQKRSFPTGEVTVRLTVAERLDEYRRKLEEYRDLSGQKLWVFGKDVEKANLKTAQADVAKLREALLSDLEKTQTASFIQALNNLAAQSVAGPVGDLAGLLDEAKKPIDKLKKASDDEAKKLKQAAESLTNKADQATSAELEELKKLGQQAAAAQKKYDEAKNWYAATEKALSRATALNKLLAPLRPVQAAKETIKPIDLKAVHASIQEMDAALPEGLEQAEQAANKATDSELKEQALDIVKRAKNATEPIESGLKDLPEAETLPPPPPSRFLWWLDFLTRWGLTVIGACILVGFLTRINCWLAAMFLLVTYLAVPAWPWLPPVGPSEGNYFFVNKNLVEMFALCVLGCLPTGRWFGADGMLRWLWNWFTGTVDDEPEDN